MDVHDSLLFELIFYEFMEIFFIPNNPYNLNYTQAWLLLLARRLFLRFILFGCLSITCIIHASGFG